MLKVLLVAGRDFKAVVFTKGFAFSVVFPPFLMLGAFVLMPLLMNKATPSVKGHLALRDETGQVAPIIEKAFSTEEQAKRQAAKIEKGMAQAQQMGVVSGQQMEAAKMAAAAATGTRDIGVRVLKPDADIEAQKQAISKVDGKSDKNTSDTPLALAIIAPDSLQRSDGKFGEYQLLVAPKLDPEVQEDMTDQLSKAIVDARLAQAGIKVDQVRDLMERPKAVAKTVTAEGERKTSTAAAMLVPFGFLMLLWISVFSAGQYLLTSTVEEKSTRVMEILLSALSPMQLMVGKVLGGMGVGLLILVAYTTMGGGALVAFKMGHLLDPATIIYFIIFFIIAFFLIASMMAAIGSAVNEMREAQALMSPVMIVLIIPMMLWMPIMRNPNSTFATVVSFIPPINPFVMVLRLSGSEKIPHWQVFVSIGVGAIAAVFAAWAAGKIFRIGVLMYGKPPNLPTLIRWIRMA